MPERHIVIVGGGISGLAAAYRLHRRAKAEGMPLRLTVVERERRWGGKILTVRENGFVIEGGPDNFVTVKPQALRLCEELGLAHRLLPTNPQARRVFILWQGKLRLLPHGFLTFTPDLKGLWQTDLLSWRGKLRMMLGIALPKPRWDDDVNVGTFLRYYLGKEMTERVVAPLIAGVYGGDANALSARATLPILWQLAHRYRNLLWASLLRSLQRRSQPPIANYQSPSFFMTLQNGLGEMTEAILSSLHDVNLINGRTVVELRPNDNGYVVVLDEGGRLNTNAIIVATPADAVAELLRPHDEMLAKELVAIPHADAVTVSLALDRGQVTHPLNGSGFLVAKSKDGTGDGRRETGKERLLMACTWTSSKFPPRAPKGKVLLRAFVGQSVDVSDEELVCAIVKELRPLLGIQGEPHRAWVFRWEQAMPQYIVGHANRVERIRQRLARFRRLALAGNYLTGIGIPDCIRSGEDAAEKVWQSLIP